jgi:hypothetical protein
MLVNTVKFKCPFKINKSIENQVKYLRNVYSTIKVASPKDNDSMKYVEKFYKNCLHPRKLDNESWYALKKMCQTYEKRLDI